MQDKNIRSRVIRDGDNLIITRDVIFVARENKIIDNDSNKVSAYKLLKTKIEKQFRRADR